MITNTTNPVTGKQGKTYQYDGKKHSEKFMKVAINAQPCIISSLGNIWIVESDNNYTKMNPTPTKGYLVAKIRNRRSGKTFKYSVHREVAKYFVPKTRTDALKDRNIVYIKDRKKENIKPENLMWVNNKELSKILSFSKKVDALKKQKKSKFSVEDFVTSEIDSLLTEHSGYTVPEILKLFQLENIAGIKETLNKRKKELKK